MASAAISIGAARNISAQVASTAQQKIGSRVQVMPGARIAMIVTAMFSPSSIIEMPTSAKNTM